MSSIWKAGIHEISVDAEISIKLDTLTREIETLALTKGKLVMNISKRSMHYLR